VSRRRALAWGLAAVAVYAGAAALSGTLSVLARRPLLDGLAPPTPYRWVEPPPELEATNLAPTPGEFEVELGRRGTDTTVLTTDDVQVTLVMPRGAFAAATGQRAVLVRVEPVAPSTVREPTGDRAILGNVYRLDAGYLPSGEPAELAEEVRLILVYPFLGTDHGSHEVLVSTDGTTWETVETNDLPSIQQADGPIRELALVAVSRDVTQTSVPQEHPRSVVAIVAMAVGLVALAIGVAVVLWPRRRPPQRERRPSGAGR
jgi:hypothetical protein